MRIRADEHVSEEIVHAVRKMALSPGWQLTHVAEVGDRGTEDPHWITRFANDGGQAILSADKDFLKRPHQVKAIFDTGLKIIHLPAKWANAPCHLQAAHILMWWRRIELKIRSMRKRECYRPPWNVSEAGDLKKVRVNYAQANKKVKKATRRTAG